VVAPAGTPRPQARTRAAAAAKRSGRADGSLHVVMVASEARPFATTGGLSEVLHALPRALGRLGHRVTIILPKYRRAAPGPAIAAASPTPHRDEPAGDEHVLIDFGARHQPLRFDRVPLSEHVTAVLVDVPELFDRDGVYGEGDSDYPDNAYRFAVLSRAALEYLRLRGERPSVIHAHDWQAGLVPAYQKMLFSNDPIVGGVPAVFTIHNLAFQGVHPASTLEQIGLPRDVLHVQAMEYWGRISYLKAGINFSERLTTVSPTYSRQILNPEFGFGLDGVLSRRARSLVGILNGIDVERWNPATDAYLPARYDADDLSGKAEAKRVLLQTVGLPDSVDARRRPVIGLVSRLTDQKGFDLIAAAAGELMDLDAAWVMLGSGERRYEDLWRELAARHPDRVFTSIGFDDRLEHLITAGADAFLMPSRFEPCGLNQLNCLRYGTLPIVRATGGLDDTVRDADDPAGNGTGFKFADYTVAALVGAIRRALDEYRRPERWKAVQHAAMRQDYSWDVSAREYVKVYSATS
jgi:starch synthase